MHYLLNRVYLFNGTFLFRGDIKIYKNNKNQSYNINLVNFLYYYYITEKMKKF